MPGASPRIDGIFLYYKLLQIYCLVLLQLTNGHVVSLYSGKGGIRTIVPQLCRKHLEYPPLLAILDLRAAIIDILKLNATVHTE